MEEAKQFGALRAAAADALVRTLNDLLIVGWGNGVNFDFRRAASYGDWVSTMGVHLRDDVVEAKAKEVFKALSELLPPKGWKPASPEDPLIREAFDRGWVDG